MMGNLIKLLNDWEIQLLVLLSFTLQIFLFFTGGLRQHINKMVLRFSIWMSYLGADLVAVYSLGYLSRHLEATTETDKLRGIHPLAFFWAPFLLTHLGVQDTITAFSMEDNKLWLRHLLNMMVQVGLAIYVFWKSIGRHSVDLLVSGIFVFVAGVIKYGERIWSLNCGSMESLKSSSGNHYKHLLPELTEGDVPYCKTVCTGLRSMLAVLNVITERSFKIGVRRADLSVVDVELGILFNDLCTKSPVIRTRIGIIIRCISHVASLVAFMIFVTGDRQGYDGIDVAITYLLFIGGFFLEVCALFNLMMSPWTWAWLKARRCNLLARFSWNLFCNGVFGWKRTLSSRVMGQYNLRGWLVPSDQPRSFNQHLMTMAKKLVALVGANEEILFWLDKLLFTAYSKAHESMQHLAVVTENRVYEPIERRNLGDPSGWYQLRSFVTRARDRYCDDFGGLIVFAHMVTEEHLSKHCSPSQVDATPGYTESQVLVCQQLSRYMMYLLVTHPDLLPLTSSAVATLEEWQREFKKRLEGFDPPASSETLDEFKELWTSIFSYAAAKSPAELHASLLARGGEPLTCIWLLMAHIRYLEDPNSLLSGYRSLDMGNIFRRPKARNYAYW